MGVDDIDLLVKNLRQKQFLLYLLLVGLVVVLALTSYQALNVPDSLFSVKSGVIFLSKFFSLLAGIFVVVFAFIKIDEYRRTYDEIMQKLESKKDGRK